jgi:hypothetical protein
MEKVFGRFVDNKLSTQQQLMVKGGNDTEDNEEKKNENNEAGAKKVIKFKAGSDLLGQLQ